MHEEFIRLKVSDLKKVNFTFKNTVEYITEFGKNLLHSKPSMLQDIEAKKLCENDIQCGGFTFKGTKHGVDKREIYFFHFVADAQISLEDYLKYPHWSTYIVSSRDFVIIRGRYPTGLASISGHNTKHM